MKLIKGFALALAGLTLGTIFSLFFIFLFPAFIIALPLAAVKYEWEKKAEKSFLPRLFSVFKTAIVSSVLTAVVSPFMALIVGFSAPLIPLLGMVFTPLVGWEYTGKLFIDSCKQLLNGIGSLFKSSNGSTPGDGSAPSSGGNVPQATQHIVSTSGSTTRSLLAGSPRHSQGASLRQLLGSNLGINYSSPINPSQGFVQPSQAQGGSDQQVARLTQAMTSH